MRVSASITQVIFWGTPDDSARLEDGLPQTAGPETPPLRDTTYSQVTGGVSAPLQK